MEAEGLGSAASAVADDDLAGRVDRYESLAGELAQAAAVIAAFGTADGHRILTQVVELLAEVTDARADGGWSCLARYPALVLFYAAGTSAVAHGRFDVVRALVEDPVFEEHGRRQRPTTVLAPAAVLDTRIATKLPGLERHKTPMSDRLHDAVRPWLRIAVPSDIRYERAFDDWEYLLALVEMDAGRGWAPIGRWGWKGSGDLDPGGRLAIAVDLKGADAPLLAGGLFGGSPERFAAARTNVAGFVSRTGFGW